MANLNITSKKLLEKYLEMGGGYVLDFSNITFTHFFDDYGIDIDAKDYMYGSGSKANRLRGFWEVSDDVLVGKVLLGLIEYSDAKYEGNNYEYSGRNGVLRSKCIDIANILLSGKYENLIPQAPQMAPQAPPMPKAPQMAPQAPPIKRPLLGTQKVPIQPINSDGTSRISKTELAIKTEQIIQSKVDSVKQKVFIVHGHDENLRLRVENFISKVGLEPIVLMDQGSSSNTIIEKFEKYSIVDYAIILYTPCDEGRKVGSSELKKRARQNVVFEHGYFISSLGRDKVAAIVDENVEIQNDIQGVVYIHVDSNWQNQLLKEFRIAGLSFDANLLF